MLARDAKYFPQNVQVSKKRLLFEQPTKKNKKLIFNVNEL